MPFCHKVPADAGRVGPPIFCWADSWTVLRVSGWTRGGHLDTFPHNCQDVGARAGALGRTSYRESSYDMG